MSIHRHAAKADANQPEIISAIKRAGWEAHIVRRPCDLFCWHPRHDVWMAMEVKDPSKITKAGKPIHDERMAEQHEFLERTGTPVVTTPAEALIALAARLDKLIAMVAVADQIRGRGRPSNRDIEGGSGRATVLEPAHDCVDALTVNIGPGAALKPRSLNFPTT